MYPAFAVAEALQNPDGTFPPTELVFIGGADGLEAKILARSGITWAHVALIQGGPVHGVHPLRMLVSVVRLGIGSVQAFALLRRLRPDRALITGGWASLPVALAAWLRRVPVVAFVPDIEPALTLKLVGRFARKVAATTGGTAAYFRPGQVVATGYPLRREVLAATREAALAHFGLDPVRRTLLVTGGSRGARSINRALWAILPELLRDDTLQVVHISGALDWPEVQAARDRLLSDVQARYHAFAYLHGDMGLALAAADLVVSRAGASTLGEFPQFGLPAILVPYPYAWRYQKVNADYLVSRGAALCLNDETLPEALLPAIRRLLDDTVALQRMAECARALARPDGARRLARLLIDLEVA